MPNPHWHFQLNTSIIDSYQSEVVVNFVRMRIDTLVHFYIRDSTNHQILSQAHQPLPRRFDSFTLPNTNLQHIYEILRTRRLGHKESEFLASKLAPIATNNQSGVQTFDLNFFVTVTYERGNGLSYDPFAIVQEADVLGRMLLQSATGGFERLRSLVLEPGQPCAVCFNRLAHSGRSLMRMSCAHFFHYQCIMWWLRRGNSCPMCRRILYSIQGV